MDAVAQLRRECPALGLTLGFTPAHERNALGDMLLLWLELNRARNASEPLIATARITWWQEALKNPSTSQGVPLAQRLSRHVIPAKTLSLMIADIAELTLNQTDDKPVMLCFAKVLGEAFGGDANELAEILLAVKSGLAGESQSLLAIESDVPTAFRIMAWLTRDAERLRYPDKKPWTALAMFGAVLFRKI